MYCLLCCYSGLERLSILCSRLRIIFKRLKIDEPATLNVKRNDEIGEVAEALTEMEKALQKQNREKKK